MKFAVFLVLSISVCFVEGEEFGRWIENPDCVECVSYPEIVIESAKVWAAKNIDHKKDRNNFTYNVFSSGSDYQIVINVFRLTNESDYIYFNTLNLLISKSGDIDNVVRSKEP